MIGPNAEETKKISSVSGSIRKGIHVVYVKERIWQGTLTTKRHDVQVPER